MAIAFLISLLHLKTKSAAIQVILYLIIIPLALHKLFATFSTPSLRWGELDFGGLEQITTPCYATRSFAIFLCFRTFLTSPSSRLFFFIIIMLPPKLSDWLMTAAIGASTQPQEISTVSFNPTGLGRKVSGHSVGGWAVSLCNRKGCNVISKRLPRRREEKWFAGISDLLPRDAAKLGLASV